MGKSGKSGGGGLLVLLALVVLAMVGGAWNYQRNLGLEAQQEGVRPFRGYSDEALEQLSEAYSQEAETLTRDYQASRLKRNGVRAVQGLITEKIDEFERVQKIRKSIRSATTEVATSEARLREILEEQNFRKGQEDVMLHVRRLTSL